MGRIGRDSEGLERTEKLLKGLREEVIDGGLDQPIPFPKGLEGRMGKR